MDRRERDLLHSLQEVCQDYLMDAGVFPPGQEISETIQFSVEDLLAFLGAYDTVVRALDTTMRNQIFNRAEVNTVMVAKFGIVTRGAGFKLNRRLLHAMVINGEGEVSCK